MSLPRPPVINQVIQDNGTITGEWNRWFNQLYILLNEAIINAPSDAPYIVQTLNELLPNAQALGNLSTGFAKVTNGTGLVTTQSTIHATDLENSGVTSGIYGDSTHVAQVTVNAQGIITNANSVTIVGASPIGVASGALTGNYPNPQFATQTQALDMGTNLINNVVDPVSSQDAATKHYVDAATTGLGQLINVKAASTVTLAGSPVYNNGVAGVGATLTVIGTVVGIDSISVALNDTFLFKNQTSSVQNGVYTATAVDQVAHNYTFTRSTDYDTPTKINSTTAIVVLSGPTNKSTQWALPSTITNIGVDAISYALYYFSTLDALVTFQDVTIGDATSSQHGYLAKLAGGTGAIPYKNGASQAWSTPTFPVTASATSRKLIISNGTNWVASTETYATPGTSGNVMTSDGTNWTSATPTSVISTSPTIQKFTSGSGTYTLPANVKWIEVKMVGGGGGGSGGGSGSPGTGGTGGSTTFGTSLHTAAGGVGGVGNSSGGAGGTATIGTGGAGIGVSGGDGNVSPANSSGAFIIYAGHGGASALGGAGQGGGGASGSSPAVSPTAGKTNTGGGGGGGAAAGNAFGGSGGGAGAYLDIVIAAPAGTYAYAVGAAGTAGTAGGGTAPQAGGAGGSGQIVVIEHYNY